MRKLFLLFGLAGMLISINACEKSDSPALRNETEITKKLFPIDKTHDIHLKTIMQQAIKENNSQNFATGFVQRNGYINWAYSQKATSGSNTAVIVPFSFESSRTTNGLLVALIKNDQTVTFKFLYRTQLKDQTSFNLQSLLEYFDYKQYNNGKTNYASDQQIPQQLKQKFPEVNLLNRIRHKYRIIENTSAARTECFTYTEIIDYCYVPNGEECDCDANSQYYQYSVTQTYQQCYTVFDEWVAPQDWNNTGGGGGGWDPQAQLAYQLNGILMPGDSYSFNNNIDPGQSLTFSTVAEFQNYLLANAANQQGDITEPPTLIDSTQRIEYGKFNLTFIGGVKVLVTLQNSGSGYWYIVGQSSSEYGVTLGWSWEQTATSQSTTNDVITLIVKGDAKYNLIIESIGTVYRQAYTFELKFNRHTGKIFSIAKL